MRTGESCRPTSSERMRAATYSETGVARSVAENILVASQELVKSGLEIETSKYRCVTSCDGRIELEIPKQPPVERSWRFHHNVAESVAGSFLVQGAVCIGLAFGA